MLFLLVLLIVAAMVATKIGLAFRVVHHLSGKKALSRKGRIALTVLDSRSMIKILETEAKAASDSDKAKRSNNVVALPRQPRR